MRILILDDELKSREVLKALIELYCENVEAIETCPDIKSAEKLLQSFKPNLLFMDISLREGDSFQLLNKIGDFSFEVIFITAFDENSIRALSYCGIPCLMKPIEIDQLEEAISKINLITMNGRDGDVTLRGVEGPVLSEVEGPVLSRVEGQSQSSANYHFAKHLLAQPLKQLPVFTSSHTQLVPLSSIEKLVPHKGQTLFKLNNQKDILSTSEITVFENFLSKAGFYKNRSGELERM